MRRRNAPRAAANALALGRIGFGLAYALRPELAGPTWIGAAAEQPATQVVTRAQGARDVALGAGALLALTRGEHFEARAWLAGHALADGSDFAATWVTRDQLPRRSAGLALGVAGLSAASAAWAALAMRPKR